MVRELSPPPTNKGLSGMETPVDRDEFEQHYYRGPDDDKMNGAMDTLEEGNIFINNHSLIASNSEDNRRVLDEVSEVLKR